MKNLKIDFKVLGYIDQRYDSDAGQIGGKEEKGRDSKNQKEDKIWGGGKGEWM